eukprot:2961506-Amphidinium_carterae.1
MTSTICHRSSDHEAILRVLVPHTAFTDYYITSALHVRRTKNATRRTFTRRRSWRPCQFSYARNVSCIATHVGCG